MTIEEWLVIAAAAVIFVLINIIMWSIIAEKEKRAKEADIRRDTSFAENPDTLRNDNEQFNVPRTASPKRTNNFTIKENIVIVHTDERI